MIIVTERYQNTKCEQIRRKVSQNLQKKSKIQRKYWNKTEEKRIVHGNRLDNEIWIKPKNGERKMQNSNTNKALKRYRDLISSDVCICFMFAFDCAVVRR